MNWVTSRRSNHEAHFREQLPITIDKSSTPSQWKFTRLILGELNFKSKFFTHWDTRATSEERLSVATFCSSILREVQLSTSFYPLFIFSPMSGIRFNSDVNLDCRRVTKVMIKIIRVLRVSKIVTGPVSRKRNLIACNVEYPSLRLTSPCHHVFLLFFNEISHRYQTQLLEAWKTSNAYTISRKKNQEMFTLDDSQSEKERCTSTSYAKCFVSLPWAVMQKKAINFTWSTNAMKFESLFYFHLPHLQHPISFSRIFWILLRRHI